MKEFLARKNVTPSSDVIVVEDRCLQNMGRESKQANAKDIALPRSIIEQLPEKIGKPEAVLWDKTKPGLLYVFSIPGDPKMGKFVVKVDYVIGKEKDARMAVITGSKIQRDALADRNTFEIVEGKF